MSAAAARYADGTRPSPEDALRAVRCVAWSVELPSMRTLYVSANAVDVLGFPAEAFEQPDFWLRTIHPDDRKERLRAADEAVRSGEGADAEYRVVRPDGSVRWMHDSLGVVLDAAGRPAELHGMTRDVTDRREREERLRHGAERLGLAMQLAGVCTWEWDVVEDRVHVDPRGRPMLDDPASQARTSGELAAAIHPDDRDRVARLGAKAIATGAPYRTAYRTLRPDGTVRYIETRAVARGGGPGERRIVGASRDVTDEHVALRDAQLRALLLDSLGEAVSVATADGTLVYVNAALERMFGYGPGELDGSDIRVLSARAPDAYARRVREITAAVDARGFWTGAMTSRRKDGSTLAAHGTVTRVSIDGVGHWLTVRQDMTERHRLQRDVLDASQREKEDLAHELHEGLGQQLTGIALLAGTVRDAATRSGSTLAPSLQRLAGILVEAVGTCRRLAQGVAGFSMRNGGLVTGLRELALTCERRYGATCTVEVDPTVAAELATDRARQLYWIADDALALAGRLGSPGAAIDLRLERAGGGARLAVYGGGLAAEQLDAVGGTTLRTLGYRAALLDAVVATRATPAGIVIECLCPVDEGIGVTP